MKKNDPEKYSTIRYYIGMKCYNMDQKFQSRHLLIYKYGLLILFIGIDNEVCKGLITL